MPDFAFGDQPALNEMARTDLLLDALAERAEADLDDPDDDALIKLLGDWRDDLRWPPASALVSQQEAEEALLAGMTERGRAHRGLAAVGSVAATLLVLSGFGAMVVEARPGNALYGIHAMFFDQPRVSDDQVLLSAKADLAKVQQMIDDGQWGQAQNQLAEVSSSLQAVNDGGQKQDLIDEVDLLNTRVETRDPNASRPRQRPQAPASTSQPPTTSVPPRLTAPTATPSSSTASTPKSSSPAPTPSSPAPTTTSGPPPATTTSPPATTTKSHHHGHTPTTTSLEPAAPPPTGAPSPPSAPATLVNGNAGS
ncbi:MAG: hypothetical protein JO236_07835 [Mycobacterium sp.]|uniref:anti-sigma-D factor RsdA n=1 Tax=Mycobacterium sp. TaxID=1785 RepID=UPI001ED16C95|nr:anti-sigma-D factor RsdA [Mycobacterium sp.]MBW0017437.1 hypothetical protein [Mycobacterium sp.]